MRRIGFSLFADVGPHRCFFGLISFRSVAVGIEGPRHHAESGSRLLRFLRLPTLAHSPARREGPLSPHLEDFKAEILVRGTTGRAFKPRASSPSATAAQPPIPFWRSAWRFPTQISAPRCRLTHPRPACGRMKKPRQTRGLPRLQRRGWETMNPHFAFANRSSKLLSDHDFRSVNRPSDSTQLAPAFKVGCYKIATSLQCCWRPFLDLSPTTRF